MKHNKNILQLLEEQSGSLFRLIKNNSYNLDYLILFK